MTEQRLLGRRVRALYGLSETILGGIFGVQSWVYICGILLFGLAGRKGELYSEI